jgi:hypothetical protein
MEYRLLSAPFFCATMRFDDEQEHPVSAEHKTDGRNPQFKILDVQREDKIETWKFASSSSLESVHTPARH